MLYTVRSTLRRTAAMRSRGGSRRAELAEAL